MGTALRVAFGGRIPSLRFPGWRIDTRAPGIAPRTVAGIFWGIYESAELRLVNRTLRRDLDVVELGASLGAVSSAIAQRLEPGRRMVCVEANRTLIPLLEKNVAANAPDTRVDVVHRAIDYDHDTVTFFEGDTSSGGRTVGDTGNPQQSVPACRLRDLLAEQSLGEYLLVSDIEGAEAGFITHDAEALRSCRQLLLELHEVDYAGRHWEEDDLLDVLVQDHGFRVSDRIGVVALLDR